LKSIGTQDIEFRLGNRVYTHEFLVTSLDVEYSGVFGLDILRQMEAKVDLCSSGLIIGRRRYTLAGLDDHDRGTPQVTVTKPVAKDEWGPSGLINPKGPTEEGEATGEQGAGEPDSLTDRELNPDDPATCKSSHNTMSIVLAQMVTLPPRSRIVAMGRMLSKESGQERLRSVMVEPVPMKNPGVYVARVVSDVCEKIHQSFRRLSDAHRSSLDEVQGVPEENGEVRVVTSGSQGDRENCNSRGSSYCMIEMINTSASTVEIERNVKIGEGEPLELREADIVTEEIRANCGRGPTNCGHVSMGCRPCDVNEKRGDDVVEIDMVCRVNETDREASIPPSLEDVIMRKLTHLVKAERDILGPVMKEFYDLFLYDRSGMLPCTTKGYHEIKTGDALPIKKNPYKVPFALRAEMKRQTR